MMEYMYVLLVVLFLIIQLWAITDIICRILNLEENLKLIGFGLFFFCQ